MPLDIALLLEDMTASWLKWMALIGGTLGVVGAGLQLMDRLVPVLKWIQRRILNPVWNSKLTNFQFIFLLDQPLLLPNSLSGFYF